MNKLTETKKNNNNDFVCCNLNFNQFEFFFISNKQGYKVFYTMTPNQPEASWDSQMVDNSELTTISELTPLAIYTVRVQAFTSMGAGPMSNPVKVKTQQGMENIRFLYLSFSFAPPFFPRFQHMFAQT